MTEQLKPLNIYQRVLAVMSELHYVQKGDKTVNGQYTFVSHDSVSEKVQPLLVKHGIVVVPNVRTLKQEHNRTEIVLDVTFINTDMPSDAFNVCYPGYGIDNGDKGPGKAISYAFKYALLKTFCLKTGDDPDNDANVSYEPPKCLEFDSILPGDMSDKDKTKMRKFLAYCSQAKKMHVEDVKREAVQRPDDFLRRFYAWEPTKKSDA